MKTFFFFKNGSQIGYDGTLAEVLKWNEESKRIDLTQVYKIEEMNQ